MYIRFKSVNKELVIPNSVKELTYKFEYNNIESLEKKFKENELVCEIVEPMIEQHIRYQTLLVNIHDNILQQLFKVR